jgi:hypothetical protein
MQANPSIQCCGSASGIQCFLTPGSRIQDVKKSESGMIIFDHIYESLLTFFWLKYNALSIQCCGSGIQEEGERRSMSMDKGRFPSRSLRDLLIKETTLASKDLLNTNTSEAKTILNST